MITPSDYKSFSDNLANGQDQEELIIGNFDDILANMAILLAYIQSASQYNGAEFYNSPIGGLDAEITNNKEKIQDEKIDTATAISSVVFALQKHVEDNYGDINDFLSDNAIKVKQTFADLSEIEGYTIDPGNIEI